MTRITVVTRFRLIAAIAPIILLVAAPFLAGGFYVLGREIETLHDRQLAAMQAARGMEVALYQMEWARTQHDRDEILRDQRRAFAQWLGAARDDAETEDQRQAIVAIAQQAEPLFDELRNSAPDDEAVDRKLRDLHARISDLISTDDLVLLDIAAASRREARKLIVTTLVAGLAIPWLCLVALFAMGGGLRKELRAIRESFERIRQRPSAAPLAADNDFGAIDGSLTRLGFPKPNPMLAE